jgi:hypothetical protein
MAAGLYFLLRVPDVRPERTVDEYAPGGEGGPGVTSEVGGPG